MKKFTLVCMTIMAIVSLSACSFGKKDDKKKEDKTSEVKPNKRSTESIPEVTQESSYTEESTPEFVETPENKFNGEMDEALIKSMKGE